MNKIATLFRSYNWSIKLAGAALLIALAITLFILDMERLIEAFVGILIAIYAVVRLVPFVKSQRSDLIKTINIIEITLNILVAAAFIIAAFATEEGLGEIFGYMLAGVLLLRGMVHFYGVSEGSEKGDHPTYFFHIATLIIGTIIVLEGFNATQLSILIALISLIGAGYLGFEGYQGYSNYRQRKQLERPSDRARDEDRVPDGIEAPGDEEKDREQDRIVS